ncbi:MAG: hypothetical protein IT209_06735 [Armatimonadetes bacterium]|nr:hypothetical protein [Armatimonadota bacterium]
MSSPVDTYIVDSASIAARLLRVSEADETVSAEEQAQHLLSEARAQAQTLRDEARQQGFREGLSEGAERFRLALEQLNEQRNALEEDYQRICDALEPEVLKLSLEIASKIVTHEVQQAPETVLQVLRLALRQLRDRGHVRLRVNRADIEMVRGAREDIAEWLDGVRDLEIIEDRRVEQGGVIVESADGILDGRQSSQIDEIHKRLEEAA